MEKWVILLAGLIFFGSCGTARDVDPDRSQVPLRGLKDLLGDLKSDPHPYESFFWGEWWGVSVEGTRVRIKIPLTLRERFDAELYLWAMAGPFRPEDKNYGDFPELFSKDVFARIRLERTASSWTWEAVLPPGVYGHSTVSLAAGEGNPLYQHDGPGLQNAFIVGLVGHEEEALLRLSTGDVYHQRHPVGWEKMLDDEAEERIRRAHREIPVGWKAFVPGMILPSAGTFRNLRWRMENDLLTVAIPERGWEHGVFLRIFFLRDHRDFPSLEAALGEGGYPFYRPELRPSQGTRTAQVRLPPGIYGLTEGPLSQERSEDMQAGEGSLFLGPLRVRPGFREAGPWFALGMEPEQGEMAWLLRDRE